MINVIFILSLIVISALVASKVFERKVRKINFLAILFSKGDVKIHEFIDFAIFKYNRYRKIASLFILDFLPAYAYELLIKLKDYVAKKYYEAGNSFQGRRILRSNGSVSTFLQNITENKPSPRDKKV